jgi:hypothetical protein
MTNVDGRKVSSAYRYSDIAIIGTIAENIKATGSQDSGTGFCSMIMAISTEKARTSKRAGMERR